MKQILSPRNSILVGIFLSSFILQAFTMEYLFGYMAKKFQSTWRNDKIQMVKSLADQISRAINAKNDLAALTALKAARSHHSELLQAMIFDRQGTIILHTDPDRLGKKVEAQPGLAFGTQEILLVQERGRPLTQITLVLPDTENYYLRVAFDETRFRHDLQTYRVRLYILLLTISIFLVVFTWFALQRYDLLNPKEQVTPGVLITPWQSESKIRRCAELLLSEMPHAVMAISRDNIIIAANSLALEILNCRSEELESMHVMQAPLPTSLQEAYQQTIKTPDQPFHIRLPLTSIGPALAIKMICLPASMDWELMLVVLG